MVLSGGGTGGHILPNIALIHELRERSSLRGTRLELLYIGTRRGMERQLMKELKVSYAGILTGKLRRYFSLYNLIDFFKIPIGFFQALFTMGRFRPDVIFCKGGYVCLPIAIAGRLLRIPVILHEADVSPGLANRLSARFATTICVAYEESRKYFPGKKVIVTGNPVRRELALGNKEDGLQLAGFDEKKPVLLCMGGSLGANFINELVWQYLDWLLERFQIIHICGQGKMKSQEELLDFLPKSRQKFLKHYRAFHFAGPELKHFYAASDVIVSRAGALTLAEIDFFGKTSVLIPLPRSASRGEQIENAEIFARHHASIVLKQEELEQASKYSSVQPQNRQPFLRAIEQLLKMSSPSQTSSAKKDHDTTIHSQKFLPLQKIIQLLEKFSSFQ